MTKKVFYIQTVKPVEEVKVKPEGSTEQPIIVGFKVHGLKARKELAEKQYTPEYVAALVAIQALEEKRKAKEEAGVELTAEEVTEFQATMGKFSEELAKYQEIEDALLKADILYFKNVTAVDYDDLGNQVGIITVPNTAKAEPSDYWDTPEECLQGFVEQFCDNKAWLDAIKAAHTEVMQKDFKELQVKNS